MLMWMPFLGWAKNQGSACSVSMFGNYYPKRFPGHSHFRILVFPHQQQIEKLFQDLGMIFRIVDVHVLLGSYKGTIGTHLGSCLDKNRIVLGSWYVHVRILSMFNWI